MNQQRVFGSPSQTCGGRKFTFECRGGVHGGAELFSGIFGGKGISQLVQSFFEHFVVIVAMGVSGQSSTGGFWRGGRGGIGRRVVRGVIRLGHGDHRLGPGKQFVGVKPNIEVVGEVVHFAMFAIGQPLLDMIGVRAGRCRANACKNKAVGAGGGEDKVGGVEVGHENVKCGKATQGFEESGILGEIVTRASALAALRGHHYN